MQFALMRRRSGQCVCVRAQGLLRAVRDRDDSLMLHEGMMRDTYSTPIPLYGVGGPVRVIAGDNYRW